MVALLQALNAWTTSTFKDATRMYVALDFLRCLPDVCPHERGMFMRDVAYHVATQ